MKFVSERTQIAKAINFGKYPVIAIDVSEQDEYGLTGVKVRIKYEGRRAGETCYVKATLRAYCDEKVLTTCGHAICISDSFGYSDLKEMLDYANAPIIEADQDIVIALYNSKTRQACAPAIIRTGKTVSPFCCTPLTLEKFDVSAFIK